MIFVGGFQPVVESRCEFGPRWEREPAKRALPCLIGVSEESGGRAGGRIVGKGLFGERGESVGEVGFGLLCARNGFRGGFHFTEARVDLTQAMIMVAGGTDMGGFQTRRRFRIGRPGARIRDHSGIVVLGDSNSTLTDASVSLFGVGTEAGAQIGFKGTHLTNKAFDRLVLLGPAAWQAIEIRRPPFGNRPPSDLKRVWTDHYLLGATLHLP